MDSYSVRFFCPLDASPRGLAALAYVDAMIEAGFDAHIVSTTASASAEERLACGWARHDRLLLRYATGRYVNVVMGAPSDWRRCWTQKAPSLTSMGCLANILVCSEISPHAYLIPGQSFGPIKQLPKPMSEVVRAYDACIVWPEEITGSWRDLYRDAPWKVHVVPPTAASSLRLAIEGALTCP